MKKKPLPQSGFAEDLLGSLPEAAPEASDPIARFVDEVAPRADEPEAPAEFQVQLVTFLLGDDLFAIPVERVREVTRVQSITRMPQAPAHIRGVQGLRGTVLPVFEARTRLGLSPAEIRDATRIVVVESDNRRMGLLVDAVQEVRRVPATSVEPPSAEIKNRCSEHVFGTAPVAGRLALLLDLDKLLQLPELAQ